MKINLIIIYHFCELIQPLVDVALFLIESIRTALYLKIAFASFSEDFKIFNTRYMEFCLFMWRTSRSFYQLG